MSDVINAAKSGDLWTLEHIKSSSSSGLDLWNQQDDSGYFALYWAACNGHADVCRFLLSHGATLNKRLETGSTALHAAVDRGNLQCAQILIDSGSDVNLQNFNNFDTPLHLAAYRGNLDMCKLLVDNGATLYLKNIYGRTPCDDANVEHHDVIREYLHETWVAHIKSQHRTTAVNIDLLNPNRHNVSCMKRSSSDPRFNGCQGGACAISLGGNPVLSSKQRECHVEDNITKSTKNRQNKEVGATDHLPCNEASNPADTPSYGAKDRTDIYFLNKEPKLNHANEYEIDSNNGYVAPNTGSYASKQQSQKQLRENVMPKIADEEVHNLANQNAGHTPYFLHKNIHDVPDVDIHNPFPNPFQISSQDQRNFTGNDFSKWPNVPNHTNSQTLQVTDESYVTTSSENSLIHEDNRNKPLHNITQIGIYLETLQKENYDKKERISFLEEQNACLWQNCERLQKESKEKDKHVQNNNKLKEQVQALLLDLDKQRKLLQASESRSRHLAKHLFLYQSKYKSGLHSRKHTRNSSLVTFKMDTDSDTNDNTTTGSPQQSPPTHHHPLNTSPHHFKGKKSKSSSPVSQKSKSRSSSSSSSSCSRSLQQEMTSTSNASHTHLLDAIKPVFGSAGTAFLRSMSDTLRNKLVTQTSTQQTNLSLDLAGRRWNLGEDYELLDHEPVNEVRPGKLEGACSLVYRIQHDDKPYILKMMINLVTQGKHGEGNSNQVYLFQQFSAEYNVPFSLPYHRNIIHVLHHFNGHTADFQGALHKLVPKELDADVDMANETSFIVLPQYCSTLRQLVERRNEVARKLTQDDALKYHCGLPEAFIAQKLFEVLAAVDHLVQCGHVHRDIKADNIFLDNHLCAVLGDFGMARSTRGPSGESIDFVEGGQALAGNSMAWAPELIDWHTKGPHSTHPAKTLDDVYSYSDVYAVGVMMCSLFAQGPFDVSSLDITSFDISPGLCYIIQRLIAPLSHRFSAAYALAMIGIHLFGPAVGEVSTEEDCYVWLQAKMMKALVCLPENPGVCCTDSTLSIDASVLKNRDMLEKEYLIRMKAPELFICYRDYCRVITSDLS